MAWDDFKAKSYYAMRDLIVRDGPGQGTGRAFLTAFDLLKESNFGESEAAVVVDEKIHRQVDRGTPQERIAERVVEVAQQIFEGYGEVSSVVRKDALGESLKIVSFKSRFL